jgi:hypothetical protein
MSEFTNLKWNDLVKAAREKKVFKAGMTRKQMESALAKPVKEIKEAKPAKPVKPAKPAAKPAKPVKPVKPAVKVKRDLSISLSEQIRALSKKGNSTNQIDEILGLKKNHSAIILNRDKRLANAE